MKKLVIITAIALTLVAGPAGWQIGASELANSELQDDMQDLASQNGSRIGLAAPKSDDELRAIVVHKALGYGIELDPAQISVQHTGSGITAQIHLAAYYTVAVNLLVASVNLHFTPSVHGRQAGAAGVAS